MKYTYTKKSSDWLIKGISKETLKAEKILTLIAGEIYLKRMELGMDQKTFAEHLGVTQGLVSRWESGTYNFTVTTLVNICCRLNLALSPEILGLPREEKIQYAIHMERNEKTENEHASVWRPKRSDIITGGAA